jgi:hypothetical protein
MNSSRGFFRKAYSFQHQFKNASRMSQASQYANSYSLSVANQTIYSNQIRLQSTLLVPSFARLSLLNGVELEEEDSEIVIDELEDDTL